MIDKTAKIHPSSVVEDGAVIGANCEIGPFCVIGPNVVLGQRVKCHSHVAISGRTQIGEDTQIWPFASVGSRPQDLKYQGEETELVIGARNMIRESTSINLGTAHGGGITKIGDDNLFMIGSHIGHDCMIGNSIVFANNAAIAGHVHIDDHVIIGGQAGVIQFARIGRGAMIGAGSLVEADVIPYGLTVGERPFIKGLNYIGMKRKGATRSELNELKKLYERLFDGSESLRGRAEQLLQDYQDNAHAKEMLNFILSKSDRSFLTPKE